MNTFRNRLAIGLIGILILMSVAMALTIVRVEQLRSSVRLQAADQAQIQGYFELHAKLREFNSEYLRILEDTNTAPSLNFRAYRRQIEGLLFSLRADIEREQIELGKLEQDDHSADKDTTPERARLLSLANEIQSMLAGSEIAAALFRAGRKEEGLKVLKEAVDENVEHKLDAIIYQAVASDKAQARAIEREILTRFDAVADRSIIAYVVFVVLMVAVVLAILVPFTRSMAFLQEQADKLALGGSLGSINKGECREFAAVHDGLGRAAAAHALLREKRDKCEAELNQRMDAMRQIDQVRRDFLADVSHELRTPLTVLRGVAEVALRTQSNNPKELRTTMARIIDESKHVARIVDDLFFIARSQVGTLDLRTDIVDFVAVSKTAAREAEELAAQARGCITWNAPSEAIEVEGDAGRLQQLFTILVDNALKYGGGNPTIEVDHTLTDDRVIINIRDHGPGVPEEDLPYVFERLYRGAVSAEAEPNGSGLGLPLAKSIVEGHGGEISLENAKGGGAIARVLLPIFDTDALEITTS